MRAHPGVCLLAVILAVSLSSCATLTGAMVGLTIDQHQGAVKLDHLDRIEPGRRLSAGTRDGYVISGRFMGIDTLARASSQAPDIRLRIRSKAGVETIARDDLSWVQVRQGHMMPTLMAIGFVVDLSLLGVLLFGLAYGGHGN